MSAPVVIGIPTYRRPELLARLLSSLRPEIEGTQVRVVVADNDAGDVAPRVVRESGVDALCLPVTERGISQVRNALVRAATQVRPDWRWLVMLDDDGYVTPGWFTTLLTAAEREGADVLGGPVLGDLPADASRLARRSVYAGRTRHPSGPVNMLNGAQNIAIGRHIVDVIGDPWFPVELGRAGGEDHYFFRRVMAEGGRLAWCDEAPVHEPTPPERLRASALLRRAFRSNLVGAQTDRAFQSPAVMARRLGVDTYWVARMAVAGVVRHDADRLAGAAMGTAGIAGRLAGFIRRTPPTGPHTGVSGRATRIPKAGRPPRYPLS